LRIRSGMIIRPLDALRDSSENWETLREILRDSVDSAFSSKLLPLTLITCWIVLSVLTKQFPAGGE
jgi:hypothetical protein